MSTKNMPWFRMYTEAVDDEKLRLLAFEDRWHFIALLCCKGQGILDEGGPLLMRKVAVKLGLQVSVLEEAARRLAEVGLIDRITLQPIGWDERQMRSDSSADRTRAYRERMKQSKNVTVTSQERVGDESVTAQEEEKEEETDTEEEGEEKKVVDQSASRSHTGETSSPASRSVEIAVYLRQRGIVGANSVNPNISSWGDDSRVTNEILDAALSVVASRKMNPMPGPNYLAPIIEGILTSRASPARQSGVSRDASRAAAAASIGLGAPTYEHDATFIDADFRRIA